MSDLSDYGMTSDMLPEWMRQRRYQVDWALTFNLLLGLMACLPLLLSRGALSSVGAQLEAWRIYAVSEQILDGYIYPRWTPFFNQGFGSPAFNYISPLPHFMGAAHRILGQTSPYTSVRFMLIVSIMLGGLGVFLFVRQRWSVKAALLASFCFLASPFVVRYAPYTQTDIGWLMATSLFMVGLWTVDRTQRSGDSASLTYTAVSAACLLLAENTLSLILYLVLWLWIAINHLQRGDYRYTRIVVAGLVVGLLLSAFFTLPFISETTAHWIEGKKPGGSDLGHFFDVSPVKDALQIGIPLLTALLMGIIWMLLHPRRDWALNSLILLVLTAILWMFQEDIWQPFHGFAPLLPDMLLGPVSIITAVIAGVLVQKMRLVYQGLFVVITLLSALAFVELHAFEDDSMPLTVERYQQFERETGIYATLPGGLLLPEEVSGLPEKPRRLVEAPRTMEILYGTVDTTHIEFFVEADSEDRVLVQSFAYDGWHLTNNRQEARFGEVDGLLSIPVDEGLNRIELTLHSTEVQIWGIVTSSVGLLMLVMLNYGLDE